MLTWVRHLSTRLGTGGPLANSGNLDYLKGYVPITADTILPCTITGS